MSADGGRRRVRRRKGGVPKGGPAGPENEISPEPAAVPKPADPAAHKPADPGAHKPAPPPEHRPARTDKAERSLRGLIGAGPTQVSISAAMRARDAARPAAQDVAAAERDLTIVHRHYQPHDSGPQPKKNR